MAFFCSGNFFDAVVHAHKFFFKEATSKSTILLHINILQLKSRMKRLRSDVHAPDLGLP